MSGILFEVGDLMFERADRLIDLGLRTRHYARHIPHRVCKFTYRAALIIARIVPHVARGFTTSFAGHFPSGLDLGSPIGEAGRLSVEVAAVMHRWRRKPYFARVTKPAVPRP